MNTSVSKSDGEVQLFRDLGSRLITLMHAENFQTQLTSDESLPLFQALGPDEKKLAIAKLQGMLDIAERTLARGLPINDAGAILETFFEVSGLSSVPGLFENIAEDDCLDIYDTNHQLVFANFGLLHWVSFTLEDLLCRPWTQLLSRDVVGVHESLFKVGTEILSGQRTTLTSTAFIPDHVCREIGSPRNLSFILFPNFFAPVFRGTEVAGYLCCNKVFPHIEESYREEP